jgi:signal transduction histidine kinase
MNDDFTPCTVLLIDDESMAHDLLSYGLGLADGITLHYSPCGEQVAALAERLRPTVLLVDLRMPTVDGFDVIERLRAAPSCADVPAILLSSEDDAEIKVRAFAGGANDYLVKWPDPRELVARVRYHSAGYRARQQRDAAFLSLRHSQEELRQSQAALQHAQKLEAVGQLTGGVAHDFNNVLQIIGGNLQLLKLVGGVNEAGLRRIDTALAGVGRGARLAAHLLAFARRQPLQAVVVDLAALVCDMDEMLRATLGARFDVRIACAPDLWHTAIDAAQLQNVILNLAINARDAMANGGTLTITATNVAADAPQRARVGAGDFVCIEVRDTGSGMSAEVLRQAFEPFFTTKGTGQGTGLGLSMAYGFVKQSGGEIVLDSEPGRGTCVTLLLARSHGAASASDELPTGALSGGVETILVVEDEADVRNATVELLSTLGYQVLSAGDGAEAAAVINSGAPIDLLFTDVIMPGPVSSTALRELAGSVLPRCQVLFTSGYAEGGVAHKGQLAPGVNLLQKPYNAEALSARIRHLLRRGVTA